LDSALPIFSRFEMDSLFPRLALGFDSLYS